MSCIDLSSVFHPTGSQTGLSVKVNHMLIRLISKTGHTKPCRIIRLLDHFAEKIVYLAKVYILFHL